MIEIIRDGSLERLLLAIIVFGGIVFLPSGLSFVKVAGYMQPSRRDGCNWDLCR